MPHYFFLSMKFVTLLLSINEICHITFFPFREVCPITFSYLWNMPSYFFLSMKYAPETGWYAPAVRQVRRDSLSSWWQCSYHSRGQLKHFHINRHNPLPNCQDGCVASTLSWLPLQRTRVQIFRKIWTESFPKDKLVTASDCCSHIFWCTSDWQSG